MRVIICQFINVNDFVTGLARVEWNRWSARDLERLKTLLVVSSHADCFGLFACVDPNIMEVNKTSLFGAQRNKKTDFSVTMDDPCNSFHWDTFPLGTQQSNLYS